MSGIVESVFCRALRNSEIAIINKKFVASLFGIAFTGVTDVNIDKAIPVDVRHSDACLPSCLACHASLSRDVPELEVPFVQVKDIGTHVGCEVDVVEAIVV